MLMYCLNLKDDARSALAGLGVSVPSHSPLPKRRRNYTLSHGCGMVTDQGFRQWRSYLKIACGVKRMDDESNANVYGRFGF